MVRAQPARPAAPGGDPVQQAPLPDELPAAALLWRLVPHLPQPEPRTRQEPTAAVAVAPEAPLPARVRWQPLADAIDPRLAACPSWPLLAGALDRAERAGHDVARRLPVLAAQAPLDKPRPARALTGLLIEECPAAGLQLSPAARAADDRRRVQALRRQHGADARPAGDADACALNTDVGLRSCFDRRSPAATRRRAERALRQQTGRVRPGAHPACVG